MKRRIITAVVVVGALVALVGGWLLSQRSETVTVATAKAATQTLAVSATASGRLEAPQAVTVSAPAAGTLASVTVANGAHVEAGTVLARLDVTPLDLAVTQAQAHVAAARAMPTGSDRLNAARTSAITAADAVLADARAQRAKADIKAPTAGTVQFASLTLVAGQPPLYETHAGASVTAGQQLFTIIDPGQLQFAAQIDESDIAGVQAGQKAHVTLDAYPGRTFAGTVAAVRTAAVATSTGGVAFPVYVTLDAGDARLYLGMTGDGTVEVSNVADALVVPVQAVATDAGQRYVWKVDGDHVTRTRVAVGASTDTLAQVTSGLAAGDVVATSNLSALAEGARVHVQG